MMLEKILKALENRTDISAWSLRQENSRGAQLYAVPTGIEAVRSVASERYVVEVLRPNSNPDGSPATGAGNATLLPGADVDQALNEAVLMAGLVHNPPYNLAGPAGLPEVPLADAHIQAQPEATLEELYGRLRHLTSNQPDVRMTAAEIFAEEEQTHLVNSCGVDATQIATRLDIEWVFVAHQGERENEAFIEYTCRRTADLGLEGEVERSARTAVDLLTATGPQEYRGPVVLRHAALAGLANSRVLRMKSSGEARFQNFSDWEIGKSIFRGEVKGDPLKAWANRQLPYGTRSSVFDEDGVAAQRVELFQEGVLQAFTASPRYAQYLNIPTTGEFGCMELAPGSTPADRLLDEPHIEVVAFSWFNPDFMTGDFASEIRLGYRVENGQRTPFKGGMLIGNVLDALADVRWSSETGFYGDYFGPTTARFNQLQVTG